MLSLAPYVAAHALPLLAGLIGLAALATSLLWRRAERRSLAFPAAAIALLALTAFAVLACAPDVLTGFDLALAEALRRSVSTTVLRASFAITQLGNFTSLLAVGAVVALWLAMRRRWLDLAAWVAATAGNGLLNRLVKQLAERGRPLHDHGLVLEPGWSFPSGHASGSLAVYGMFAWLLLRGLPPPARLPLLIASLSLVLLIGFSRVLLQVHYFSDVLAGFALASAWLAICIGAAERLRR